MPGSSPEQAFVPGMTIGNLMLEKTWTAGTSHGRDAVGVFALWRGRASALRLGFRAGRAGAAAAAISHELIELGLVLGVAQALQEFPELALLLFEPAQRLGAIFVARPISARPGVAAAVAAARRALGVLPPPARAGAGAMMSASHSSAP